MGIIEALRARRIARRLEGTMPEQAAVLREQVAFGNVTPQVAVRVLTRNWKLTPYGAQSTLFDR